MSMAQLGPASLAAAALKAYSRPWPWQRDDTLRALELLSITQRSLALEMGATESQLSDWLRGRDGREPSFETRVRMDAALQELVYAELQLHRGGGL